MAKFTKKQNILIEIDWLKEYFKEFDFQMGIGGSSEKNIKNQLNKIRRMVNSF